MCPLLKFYSSSQEAPRGHWTITKQARRSAASTCPHLPMISQWGKIWRQVKLLKTCLNLTSVRNYSLPDQFAYPIRVIDQYSLSDSKISSSIDELNYMYVARCNGIWLTSSFSFLFLVLIRVKQTLFVGINLMPKSEWVLLVTQRFFYIMRKTSMHSEIPSQYKLCMISFMMNSSANVPHVSIIPLAEEIMNPCA